MPKIKEMRIDAVNYPFHASHLIIHSNGVVESVKNNDMKQTKLNKKGRFFEDLEGALMIDFKMLHSSRRGNDYYHISVIYDDESEESHFYQNTLAYNNQITLKEVLFKYIPQNLLIDCITVEDILE